jgi:uncharacterized protein
MEPARCSVTGVFVASSEQGSTPVVLISPGGDLVIPIFIGLFEAISIHSALRHDTPPRPMTHDLFIDLVNACKVTLDAVMIDQIDEGVYFARLLIRQDIHEISLDCRPSDGIAIAIRAGAKILVDQEVIAHAAVSREKLAGLADIDTCLGQ